MSRFRSALIFALICFVVSTIVETYILSMVITPAAFDYIYSGYKNRLEIRMGLHRRRTEWPIPNHSTRNFHSLETHTLLQIVRLIRNHSTHAATPIIYNYQTKKQATRPWISTEFMPISTEKHSKSLSIPLPPRV